MNSHTSTVGVVYLHSTKHYLIPVLLLSSFAHLVVAVVVQFLQPPPSATTAVCTKCKQQRAKGYIYILISTAGFPQQKGVFLLLT